jgi:hypothetical protein
MSFHSCSRQVLFACLSAFPDAIIPADYLRYHPELQETLSLISKPVPRRHQHTCLNYFYRTTHLQLSPSPQRPQSSKALPSQAASSVVSAEEEWCYGRLRHLHHVSRDLLACGTRAKGRGQIARAKVRGELRVKDTLAPSRPCPFALLSPSFRPPFALALSPSPRYCPKSSPGPDQEHGRAHVQQ